MSAWRLVMPRGVGGLPPVLPPFVPGIDPNWWQRWQYKGTLPTVVMDFQNGLYWDGTQNQTNVSLFVNNATVVPGSGLLCNAANITAKGALLSAFQGASGYAAQVSTFGEIGRASCRERV